MQIFHGQTQISMTKNCTFSFSAHVFIVKTCYALVNIFMGKVQHFHWQSTTYSWANWIACHMRAPRMCCWVNKMITGRSCEKSPVYQLRVDNVLPATSLGSSSWVLHFGIHLMGVHGLGGSGLKLHSPADVVGSTSRVQFPSGTPILCLSSCFWCSLPDSDWDYA